MLEKLKEDVFKANIDLVRHGLVIHTWGNVSGLDHESGLIVIKPSGVAYESMGPDDMVVVDVDGKVIEGKYKPSTDTPTHLVLYRVFKNIGGIVHTHSSYATSWAQAGRAIPPLGTTHADHFFGEVPCTRLLSDGEIETDYEINTGHIIVEALKESDPLSVTAVLVNGHGPFCWGHSAADAAYNAVVLEEISKTAFMTVLLGKDEPVRKALLYKHFTRKHGKEAYYGQ